MSRPVLRRSTLVRVTVVSGTRRVDLALPGAVPVAELVPELVRSVGALAVDAVHRGHRLRTADGRVLAADAGLVSQGVADGDLLTVAAGTEDEPRRVYDDVVEAMADAVEQFAPWTPVAGRRAAVAAAGSLLALGAVALLGQRAARPGGVLVVLVAVILVAAAIALSRLRGEVATSVLLGWLGSAYAATAGPTLVAGGSIPGSPILAGAAGALVAALVGLVGLRAGRALLLPPAVTGAVFVVAGLLDARGGVEPTVAATVALVCLVAVGGTFPWLAVGLTQTSSSLADEQPVDLARVAADARLAHEILLAILASVGLLLVLVAPLAVSLGVPGALVAGACCATVLLRTRRHRTASEVLVGLAFGVTALLVAAGAALWLHPGWRTSTAVLLVLGGLGSLAVTLSPSRPGHRARSARVARIAEIAEIAALLALPGLTVVAVGLVAAARA